MTLTTTSHARTERSLAPSSRSWSGKSLPVPTDGRSRSIRRTRAGVVAICAVRYTTQRSCWEPVQCASCMARLLAVYVLVGFVSAAPTSAIRAGTAAPPETRAEETPPFARGKSRENRRRLQTMPSSAGFRIAEERLTRLSERRRPVPEVRQPRDRPADFCRSGYRNRRVFNREGAVTAWVAGSLKNYGPRKDGSTCPISQTAG